MDAIEMTPVGPNLALDRLDMHIFVQIPTFEKTKRLIMEQKFCQSCGMPLTEEIKGTNADGSKNEDYCIYCYKDGAFTRDCTMEEMIDFCAQFVDEVNKNMPRPMTQEEYKQMMRQYFPKLKRWESAR